VFGIVPRHHITLLCVDDDQVVLDWLVTTLSTAGYTVEAAQNGFIALMKVSKGPQRFGLILTDLRMPGLDGFEFIEQSRAAGYDGKFLVYAASITPDALLRLRELRVERVIEKPVRGGGLIDAVREIVTAGG
jgi:CheY-like chemotaxis protein